MAVYLPSFQMSAESFHWLPTFRQTTRYLPTISFGVGSFVLRLKVPISRADEGPSRFTSRVVTFGSLTWSAIFFHIAPIAALPFIMLEPGGNAVASSVYRDPTPVKSPLLNNSIHFAFTDSISAFWAKTGAVKAARSTITKESPRMRYDLVSISDLRTIRA